MQTACWHLLVQDLQTIYKRGIATVTSCCLPNNCASCSHILCRVRHTACSAMHTISSVFICVTGVYGLGHHAEEALCLGPDQSCCRSHAES